MIALPLLQYLSFISLHWMTSKLFGNLSQSRDEDLRKSLFPISDIDNEYRFTKFIRFRNTEMLRSKGSQVEEAKINFNPEVHNESLPFNEIIKRYHDASFVVKPRQPTLKEKAVQFWLSLIKHVLFEKQQEYIFKKQSRFLLIWNFLLIYAYLLNYFEIPVSLFLTKAVYEDQYNTIQGLLVNWIAVLIIIINIVLVRPNTQLQKYGYLIFKRSQIMQNYIGRKFILDMVSLLILLIYSFFNSHNLIYLKLLFYFSLPTVLQVDNLIIDKLELKTYRYAAYKVLRLLVYMLFILFWLSSIFFYIDYRFYVNSTYPIEQNWLTWTMCAFQDTPTGQIGTDLLQTYPQQWYIWLNYAMYWALQTVSTVGYGDITPRNPPSVVFTNISILITMFFFVFFINNIIEIIDETTTSEDKQKKENVKKFKIYYNHTLKKFDDIGLKYGYPPEKAERKKAELRNVSNSIRSYLFQMDIQDLLEQEQNVQKLVNQNLTPELREELFINYRQLFFKKILVFGEIAKISPEFMQVYEKLIYKIKEVPFGGDEVVYAKGTKTSNSLYYLLKGSVLITYPTSKYSKTIQFNPQNHNPNDQSPSDFLYFNFGVREFFTRQTRDHNAITQSYSKIQRLDYQDFIDTIKEYSNFYDKFCQLRDSITILRNNTPTGQQCLQCSSRKHHLFTCDKCLFNMKLKIQAEWAQNYKIQVNQPKHLSINPRVSFYYRDRIVSPKVNPKNIILRHRVQYETVHNFKFYYPNGNIADYQNQ